MKQVKGFIGQAGKAELTISTAAQNSLGSHSFIGVVRPHTKKMTNQCEIA
jgi:hypothetical protein